MICILAVNIFLFLMLRFKWLPPRLQDWITEKEIQFHDFSLDGSDLKHEDISRLIDQALSSQSYDYLPNLHSPSGSKSPHLTYSDTNENEFQV